MPTIHEVLDDSQKQCKALVNEINTFKQARILNQKAAVDSLDATCAALQKTTKAVRPFTKSRIRWFMIIIGSATLLNTLLFVTILLLIIFKK